MNIPLYLLEDSTLVGEIITLVEEIPNDMDLGKTIRKLVCDYKEQLLNSEIDD